MKICTICGAENESESIRCCLCQSFLPEVEVFSAQVQPSEQGTVKICDRCGAVCDKNAVKCTKCGRFLNVSRVNSVSRENSAPAPLTARIDSGEIITLEAGQIIGRQYQPRIWDVYTPRVLYKVHFTDGHYMLENLKDSSFQPVRYGTDYSIGRKKMRFIEM